MAWRLAQSLVVLRAEANAEWPGRSTISDGTLGDAAHAARASDHNPARYPGAGPTPVVRAFDITASGIDVERYRERIRALGKAGDPRLNPAGYVISDGRIASAQHAPAWEWHPYTGDNPHDRHCHVSVGSRVAGFDSTAPWGIHGAAPPPPPTPGDDDDMFTDDDRKLLHGIAAASLTTIAEGRQHASSLSSLVRSMFMGDYGERGSGKYPKGSLGWLDRRLAKFEDRIVERVLAALDEPAEGGT